jgi:hypothetical protein
MSPEVSAAHFLKVVHIRTPGRWPSGMCDTWNMFTCHATVHQYRLSMLPQLPELGRGRFPAASATPKMFLAERKKENPTVAGKA